MKCETRLKALAGFALALGLCIVLLVVEDKCEIYDPWGYVQASIPWLQTGDVYMLPLAASSGVKDKIIVVPSREEEDTSWVADELPDWQHAIYIVNPSEQSHHNALTTPVNKGHEAMAYLTYIIDNYNTWLPSIIAFLHSHRDGFLQAWHVDTPLHNNVDAMKHLRTDYVLEKGYVNLRCNANPGCKNVRRGNSHFAGDVWTEVMGNTSTPALIQDRGIPAAQENYSTTEDKEQSEARTPRLWAACCAQFAVSREQIYRRPWEDYVKIRQWVIDTDKDDAKSGRVMEYLWHVIFGQEAVDCPDEDVCYCKVYGRC